MNNNSRSLKAAASSWIIRNLIFPVWARRDHPGYSAYIQEFERAQFLSTSEIAALQLGRLQTLLRHTYQECPFYRQRMERAGFHPDTFRSIDQLASLPVLTKADIQQHGRELEAANFPAARRA